MLKRRYWKPLAGIFFFILLISALLFSISLFKIDILMTEYLLLILAVMAFFVYLSGLLLFYGMRRKSSLARRVRRIIGVFLSIIFSVGFIYGTVLLLRIDSTKTAITSKPEVSLKAHVGVYVLKDDAAQSLSDMNGYRFAILGELGDEKLHSEYAVAKIREAIGTEIDTISYPGITDAAIALRDGEVQALAVNSIYISFLGDTENLKEFAKELRLIEEIPVPDLETKEDTTIVNNQEKTSDSVKDPARRPEKTTVKEEVYGEDRALVFYISGADKWDSNINNLRSDVNILMFVNPKTGQILLVNTPRDTFLDNPALGGGDKLTHCGIQGPENSMAALERFYGISIDNYIKVNYAGFESIVDAIGGITVEVPSNFIAENGTYFEKGVQNLDGEKALTFARERNAFGSGDLARGQNQLNILKAIIIKIKNTLPSVVLNYQELLDLLEGSIQTDLSSSQISDLSKVALRHMSEWEIKSYGLTGSSGMRVTASGGSEPLYIIWPDQNSVNFAIRLIDTLQKNEIITDALLSEAP